MRLRHPNKAHVLPILEDGLKSLIEAVEERQPVVEVALSPKRLLSVPLGQPPCMRTRMQQKHAHDDQLHAGMLITFSYAHLKPSKTSGRSWGDAVSALSTNSLTFVGCNRMRYLAGPHNSKGCL